MTKGKTENGHTILCDNKTKAVSKRMNTRE